MFLIIKLLRQIKILFKLFDSQNFKNKYHYVNLCYFYDVFKCNLD